MIRTKLLLSSLRSWFKKTPGRLALAKNDTDSIRTAVLRPSEALELEFCQTDILSCRKPQDKMGKIQRLRRLCPAKGHSASKRGLLTPITSNIAMAAREFIIPGTGITDNPPSKMKNSAGVNN